MFECVDLNKNLEKEAARIISTSSQKWNRANNGGKPVRVPFSIPIVFKLQ